MSIPGHGLREVGPGMRLALERQPVGPGTARRRLRRRRVIFVILAGIGIYTTIQGFGVSDDMSWDDSDLTSAVQQAADDLDGFRYQSDESGSPLYFDDYESLIEDKVVRYGGGNAPQTGVDATPADGNTEDDGYFTVSADGAGDMFCTHVERTRSKDDYAPPGIAGGKGSLTYRGYKLAATTQKEECGG
ncbi:hypothetical protein [Streptomyces collinus]|uniref:hypothetical protein n=1 Tax=Streptomyces collinus TaxID=42684 RepID=UPI002943C105|nr:hypothetical protein [Streptomyces collinus]